MLLNMSSLTDRVAVRLPVVQQARLYQRQDDQDRNGEKDQPALVLLHNLCAGLFTFAADDRRRAASKQLLKCASRAKSLAGISDSWAGHTRTQS